jgi:signal peptidase I
MRFFRKGSLLSELPIILVAALALSFIIKLFFVQFFYIPSGSMQNTLQIGDRVAVNKFASHFSDIRRGEVVVFKDPANWLGAAPVDNGNAVAKDFKRLMIDVGIVPDPGTQYLIKRVVGVGGDHVQCCDSKGNLMVNGVSINEPYIFAGNAPSDTKFDVTVPQGFIWVMGDHRGASADSRFHTDDIHKGMVPLADVTGRAEWTVWPINHFKFLSVGHDLSRVPHVK